MLTVCLNMVFFTLTIKIQVPTLIIHGDKDPMVSIDLAKEIEMKVEASDHGVESKGTLPRPVKYLVAIDGTWKQAKNIFTESPSSLEILNTAAQNIGLK